MNHLIVGLCIIRISFDSVWLKYAVGHYVVLDCGVYMHVAKCGSVEFMLNVGLLSCRFRCACGRGGLSSRE